ncbi:MAG: glycosyltransferase family 2 protein [Fimbriimonadaceae bacterium]|nr:glycosyltransferase family 2 protein [Chitinophagales bacterium]
MDPKVCIVLVNYKTWQDTIECIESILKSNYKNYQVVVVENGSDDDSWNNLLKWTRGELTHAVLPDNKLFRLSNPLSHKPLLYFRAHAGESDNLRLGPMENIYPILYVQSKINLGFAGGNNVGMRYALNSNFDYVWLLNNDTVIDPNAISELVNYSEEKKNKKERIGIVGSKLLVYHKPEKMQGIGAIFNKYSGKSKIIGAQEVDKGQYDNTEIKCNYVIGASMFVSKEFLLDAGLMSEEYFLYNEENDWSARAKLKGWNVGVAVKSKVYHKQGASTGNSPKKSKWQIKALNYKYRGKIKLYKKYYRPQLPFLYLHLLTRSFKYIMKGNTGEAKVIYAAIFNTKFQK